MKKLLGRTDIEDALKRLENLSHDEALMAIAQVLKATHEAIDGAQSMFSLVIILLTLMRFSWKRNKCSDPSNRELSG